MANPIRKLVQLVLDKNSAKKTEADTKKSLGAIDKGVAKLKSSFLKLGGVIAGAFAVRSIVRFGKELLSVAAESEEIWNRLGKAVENIGVSFRQARPEVEAFARAMQDTTRVGDEDFAEILTELITTSGNYQASLRNVSVVADLAAAKQIEFRTAAQLVGRAMVGQTGTLTRYGIVVKEGEDAVEVLRETFRGFAANEAKGFRGILVQINNEWADFKQALGEVVTQSGNSVSVLGQVRDILKDMTRWVNENKTAIGEWGRITFLAGKAIVGTFTNVIQFAFNVGQTFAHSLEVIGTQTELLIHRVRAALTPGKQDLSAYELRASIAMANMKANAEEAGGAVSDLVQNWVDLAVAIDQAGTAGRTTPIAAPPVGGGAGGAGGAGLPFNLDQLTRGDIVTTAPLDALTESIGSLNQAIEQTPQNTEAAIASLERMTMEAELLKNAAGDAAATLLSAAFGQRSIGQLAKWKAQQNAIMAAEEAAMGFVASLNPITAGSAPGHYAAAKMFAGIAAGWGALAGAAGGFSGGGGSGGAAGSPSDVGGRASERTEAPGPEVHIYFQGASITNPEVQRLVYGAYEEAVGRYGNARVKIHKNGG